VRNAERKSREEPICSGSGTSRNTRGDKRLHCGEYSQSKEKKKSVATGNREVVALCSSEKAKRKQSRAAEKRGVQLSADKAELRRETRVRFPRVPRERRNTNRILREGSLPRVGEELEVSQRPRTGKQLVKKGVGVDKNVLTKFSIRSRDRERRSESTLSLQGIKWRSTQRVEYINVASRGGKGRVEKKQTLSSRSTT